MKLILSLFLIIILVSFSFELKQNVENLCGNYSLTYSKVRDIFENSDISGISQAYNTHYNKDLVINC